MKSWPHLSCLVTSDLLPNLPEPRFPRLQSGVTMTEARRSQEALSKRPSSSPVPSLSDAASRAPRSLADPSPSHTHSPIIPVSPVSALFKDTEPGLQGMKAVNPCSRAQVIPTRPVLGSHGPHHTLLPAQVTPCSDTGVVCDGPWAPGFQMFPPPPAPSIVPAYLLFFHKGCLPFSFSGPVIVPSLEPPFL